MSAEPALHRAPAGAIHWSAPWTCLSPGKLVGAYARPFEARGGRIVESDARILDRSGAGWQVAGEHAELAIVALGPWSPELLRPLGHPGLRLHFGHGRQGFTLVPVTAVRLARAIDGDAAAVDGLDRGLE